jgi:hypothetical protein
MRRLDGSMLALRADVQALRMEIRATNSPVERRIEALESR